MSAMVIFGRGVNDRYGAKWMPTGNKEYRCNTVVYWIVGDYVCNVLAGLLSLHRAADISV